MNDKGSYYENKTQGHNHPGIHLKRDQVSEIVKDPVLKLYEITHIWCWDADHTPFIKEVL